MKLSMNLLISCLLAPAFAQSLLYSDFDSSLDSNQIHSNHVAAHGIFRSILSNRDFGAPVVIFSEWLSPNGEIYVVPSTNDDTESDQMPAMGLGYKFVNNDNSIVQSLDISNVAEIKEENILAQGFPFGWKKHEKETAEDFFPFGSKKFMMIGLNKNSFDSSADAIENTDNHYNMGSEDLDYIKEYNGYVSNSGLLKWFKEGGEEDDCNADGRTNKLFDTDHFLFVGVGSIDMELPQDAYSDIVYKRDTESIKVITYYTTTTVTSTHGVTITHTDHPEPTNHYKEHVEPTELPSTTDFDTTLQTTTHVPFIFSTSKDDEILEETPTLTVTEPVPDVTYTATLTETEKTSCESSTTIYEHPVPPPETTSVPETEYETTEASSSEIIETTTSDWTVPETWNSYPFTTTETNFGPVYSSHPIYMNTTTTADISTIDSTTYSTFNQFHTSLYGNDTDKVNNGTKPSEGSIFTRTRMSNMTTNVTTSENAGNGEHAYLGSLCGLIFVFVSGIILI